MKRFTITLPIKIIAVTVMLSGSALALTAPRVNTNEPPHPVLAHTVKTENTPVSSNVSSHTPAALTNTAATEHTQAPSHTDMSVFTLSQGSTPSDPAPQPPVHIPAQPLPAPTNPPIIESDPPEYPYDPLPIKPSPCGGCYTTQKNSPQVECPMETTSLYCRI